MTQCSTCGKQSGMAFECISCCVRWLSMMTKAEMQLNAPVIEIVMGAEHMEKVREAWKGRNEEAKNQTAARSMGMRR